MDIEKRHPVISKGNKFAPLGIMLFWLAIMAALYFGFKQYEKPKTVITSNGYVVIQRHRY